MTSGEKSKTARPGSRQATFSSWTPRSVGRHSPRIAGDGHTSGFSCQSTVGGSRAFRSEKTPQSPLARRERFICDEDGTKFDVNEEPEYDYGMADYFAQRNVAKPHRIEPPVVSSN